MGYPAEYDQFELEVRWERDRQNKKWGEQNHADGTGTDCQKLDAQKYRLICQKAAAEGRVTFRHILYEEVAEAFAETDPLSLKTELIQIAAVCKQWIEAIERRPAETQTEHHPLCTPGAPPISNCIKCQQVPVKEKL